MLSELADRPRGLVLVTGPTGSGKSTTLAAMIDRINQAKAAHILTIEDPIEYLHQHKKCLVNQRELHADTQSFTMALRAALREDPDVVLVGEMRDLETMEAALKLAETGHLTMATLHTNSAAQTITRVIDAFPAHQQAQIRTQLSLVLEGVVCQALIPKASGSGRVAALEILVATPAIRNLIRDDKIHQIYGTMQAGQEKYGMQTMNQSLARLVEKRVISRDAAFATSSNRDELILMLERGTPHPAAVDECRGPPAANARSCTMTTYAWVGRTRTGQIVKGERAAESTNALTETLRREQILVTKIAAAAKKEERFRRVAPRSLAIFTRQFSVMIDAGLPLVQCLELLAKEEPDKPPGGGHRQRQDRRRRRHVARRRDAAPALRLRCRSTPTWWPPAKRAVFSTRFSSAWPRSSRSRPSSLRRSARR